MRRLPLHGRGAAGNPPNRFQSLELEREAWDEAEDPGPDTRFLRDRARNVITTNDSPDVGFDASLNPYRGCEHGCVYCLSGDTPILMADGTHEPLGAIEVGNLIYGTRKSGHYRRYVRTRVLARWTTVKPSYLITLADGTTLIASGDHRFLTRRGWKHVTSMCQGRRRRPHLTVNDQLLGTGGFAPRPEHDRMYRRGYLCGMIRGDGSIGHYSYQPRRGGGNEQHRFRFQERRRGRRRIDAIRTCRAESVACIEDLIGWPENPDTSWSRGFLAGTFDAEGSFSAGVLRIANTDQTILARAVSALSRLGFDAVLEPPRENGCRTVRLRGGLSEQLRFLHSTDPAVCRKRDIEGTALKSLVDLTVNSVEPTGRFELLHDITTGTGDFIANGVVSHNCYARPTHEYLGFSSGLDFESRILVKEEAPALLREELADDAWEPRTLALSGVTDPYQPVERRLGITRGCLEVLAEASHPVAVVTKSRLVLRDTDLLGRLAERDAARVSISITTLDEELRRIMEPRAPTAEARLDAVRGLAEAGVPVGVMIAPVIPGLNDEEVPSLLEAAAEAGASHAGYVLLRLPHKLKELFETWLEQHFPGRKEKVLGRLREARGGRLNDPRFGTRMRGEGAYAGQLRELFRVARRRHGLDGPTDPLSTAAFRRPVLDGSQIDLFEAVER